MSSLKKFFQYFNDKGKPYYYDTKTGRQTYKFPAESLIFDPATGALIYSPTGVRTIDAGTSSARPTSTSSDRPTPTSSVQPTPTSSVQPTPTSSVRPTPTSSVRPTPTSSVQPTPTSSVQPTPTSSLQPTPTFSVRPASAASPNPIPAVRDRLTPVEEIVPQQTIMQTVTSTPTRTISDWVKVFDDMQQVRILGKGSFGTVKLVEDQQTKERIAVKYFNDPPIPDPNLGMKFMNEVEMMINLQHPCILPIIGYSLPTRHSVAQLGMKFAVNGSLRFVLDQSPRPSFMDDTGTAIIICGLVYGLKFLHSRNVIHRGLKPSNILIDEHGWPLIGDFEVSRFLDMNLTQTKQIGAPCYMAPEMYEADEYTAAVDVFSFGLILYEIMVGHPVFPPTISPVTLMTKVKVGERAQLPRTMNVILKRVITLCWSPDPEVRLSMEEVLSNFETIRFKFTEKVDVHRISAYISTVSK